MTPQQLFYDFTSAELFNDISKNVEVLVNAVFITEMKNSH